MPLVKLVTNAEKMIPDENGGWYWLKLAGREWMPVKVEPKTQTGWPQSISMNSHSIDVENVNGEWGPQIFPPE